MKILLPYFSRTGHTEQLAQHLAQELRQRGHEVRIEKIEVVQRLSKWGLAFPLLSTLPVLPLYFASKRFRHWWHQRYIQPEQAIKPLVYPDVSGFDCICLGGPKWLYIAYPVARYLRQLTGLSGKPVAAFATFCGPPLKVFELEMLFAPLQRKIELQGGRLMSTLALSSQFHEFFFFHEMEYVFRLISRWRFKRALHTFSLDSIWGEQEVQRFCNEIDKAALQDIKKDSRTGKLA